MLENEFRRYCEKIFQISAEENQNYCQETPRMVEEFLIHHQYTYQTYDTIGLPRLIPGHPVISSITIREGKVALKKFKKNKAPGISKINKTVLLQLPENILIAFTHLLNASLSTGLFPSIFKNAIVKFIAKALKSPNVQNYRPMSLLETAAKIYERIINDRVKTVLAEHDKYNPKQHSYRRHGGTYSATTLLYEEIANSQQRPVQYHTKRCCKRLSQSMAQRFKI